MSQFICVEIQNLFSWVIAFDGNLHRANSIPRDYYPSDNRCLSLYIEKFLLFVVGGQLLMERRTVISTGN